MSVREYLCTTAVTVCRERLFLPAESALVTSRREHSTLDADESVLWPEKTVYEPMSTSVRVKAVWVVDANSPC